MFVIRHFLNEQHFKKKIQATLVFLASDRVRAPKEGWRRHVSPPAREPQHLQRLRGSPLAAATPAARQGRDSGRHGLRPRRSPERLPFLPLLFCQGPRLLRARSERRPLSSRGISVRAPRRAGGSRCRPQALGTRASAAARAGSQRTGDRTRVSPRWQVDS